VNALSVPRRTACTAEILLLAAALAAAPLPAVAQPKPAAPPAAAAARPQQPEWIQRSNANSQLLMGVFGKLAPEQAGRMGVPGLDAEIFDLKPGFEQRAEEAGQQALAELEKRHVAEKDPMVREDLEILIDRSKQARESYELNRRLMLPYFDVSGTVYQGLRALLDDQVAAERRTAALTRLKKYAGVEKGYEPITKLAEAHIRERGREVAGGRCARKLSATWPSRPPT
jgi:DNA-binding PadR family transcriptional regulator